MGMNLILSVNNVATSGGGGGGPTFTITGSGFGARASLTPLFYRFFVPGDFSNGASAATAGYGAAAVGDPAGVFIDTSDSFVSGYGCLKHETALGGFDSFPRLYPILAGLAERQIFQTFYFKAERLDGSGTTPRQMKGPRCAYSAEYEGAPRVTCSFYLAEDLSAISYTYFTYFPASNVESGGEHFDWAGNQTYKSRWRAGGWNLVESWIDFGSVGAADGFERLYQNGAQIGPLNDGTFNTEAMAVRSSPAHLINYVSTFPGFDAFPTTSRFRFKFCEHVVDTTAARVVVGNASTWTACTHRQYMIPTLWTDGSVTASWRPLGFASSGQTVYGYVVNSSGTVSSATALTVP